MKITYLGTAAAEGFPAVFCNCPFCQKARELGGKNRRTRSQALVDEELLIDLPADTYSHFLDNRIAGDRLKYLFITHSHSDHLYPGELLMRGGAFSHAMRSPVLQVFCGEGAYRQIMATPGISDSIRVERIHPYQTVRVGGYAVTALPARHFEGDEALFYCIQGERTILYAHDTGYFFEDVFSFIKEKHFVFDLVSLDCTNGSIPVSDEGGHMGFPNNRRVLERLRRIGAIRPDTIQVINHFSHNANPLQEVLEEETKEDGFVVAYDGMQMEC